MNSEAGKADRELLELAARAAGLPRDSDGRIPSWLGDYRVEMVPWNPLTDDGDALRLAVKLRICISHDECGCCVWTSPGPDSMGDESLCVIERMHNAGAADESIQDRATATRRAIVRCAALASAAAPDLERALAQKSEAR